MLQKKQIIVIINNKCILKEKSKSSSIPTRQETSHKIFLDQTCSTPTLDLLTWLTVRDKEAKYGVITVKWEKESWLDSGYVFLPMPTRQHTSKGMREGNCMQEPLCISVKDLVRALACVYDKS